jgi:hypothetical protein
MTNLGSRNAPRESNGAPTTKTQCPLPPDVAQIDRDPGPMIHAMGVDPPFVGRDAELALLQEHFQIAAAGGGRIVFLLGAMWASARHGWQLS